jgi:O-antigen ligase
MIRHGDRLATGLLALLLLWAPLPFGSVTPPGAAGLEAGAFLALALALALRGAPRPPDAKPAPSAPAGAKPRPGREKTAPAPGLSALRLLALPLASLAAVALWGVIQSLPWPLPVLARVSPEHARLFRGAAALLAARSAAMPAGPAVAVLHPSLSLAASESLSAALGWAAAAAALAAAALLGRERWNRRLLGAALAAAAAFQVFFGARGWSSKGTVLWGVEVPGTPRLRGSFVNPDHLALYLGMALPAVFAWGWWAARRARKEPSVERRVLWAAPPVLLWLTLFAGLAFTGSRAGLVAGVAAVGVQGLLLAGADRRPDLALVGTGAAVAGIGVVAAIGLQEGLGRLLSSPVEITWGVRRQAWAATWALFRRFPWTGAGLGAFREAFPLVQPAELVGTWRHAHNDPLELLATAGLVGTALAVPGLLALIRRLASVLRHGRRSEDRAAGLAALGALAVMAIHEPLDFGLTIPANAFTLAVLLGAAATARTDRASRESAAAPATSTTSVISEPPAGRGRRRRSAAGDGRGEDERDGAGGDGAAADALDLEPVEPGGEGGGERHRRPGQRRR